MPTGGEYRAMAAELQEHATSLLQSVPPLADAFGGDVVSVATRLGLTITRAVEAADANAASAATMMESMADECLVRATVCDEHAAAMGVYKADLALYHDRVRASATDPSVVVPDRPRLPTAPPWAEI